MARLVNCIGVILIPKESRYDIDKYEYEDYTSKRIERESTLKEYKLLYEEHIPGKIKEFLKDEGYTLKEWNRRFDREHRYIREEDLEKVYDLVDTEGIEVERYNTETREI